MIRRILIASVGCLILAVGFYLGHKHTMPQVHTVESGEPTDIGGIDYTLTDQHGIERSNQEWSDQYQIVYFGYAHCPDICPMALMHITEALKKIGRDRTRFVPIFITIDPERDTVEVMKQHAQNFDPNFIMLTGKKETIDHLQKSYRVYAKKAVSPDGADMGDAYLLDHSSLIYLMGPGGKFLQMFPHTTPGDRIAHILTQHLVKEHKK